MQYKLADQNLVEYEKDKTMNKQSEQSATFSKGYTINIGKYEFARIDASVTITDSDPKEAINSAKQIVEDCITEELQLIDRDAPN